MKTQVIVLTRDGEAHFWYVGKSSGAEAKQSAMAYAREVQPNIREMEYRPVEAWGYRWALVLVKVDRAETDRVKTRRRGGGRAMSRADEPLRQALVIVGVEGGVVHGGVYGPGAENVAVVVVEWDVLGESGDGAGAEEHYRDLLEALGGYADADQDIQAILDSARERVRRRTDGGRP